MNADLVIALSYGPSGAVIWLYFRVRVSMKGTKLKGVTAA
jgi:hypothetical protein